jgi:transcriptional regulator with XRE-family HTH domain
MSRVVSPDRPLSIHAPIAQTVFDALDNKILPALESQPRGQVAAQMGLEPAALAHYLKRDNRTSLPTLPQLERLAAAAGFRVDFTVTKDATAVDRILGGKVDYVAPRRGRPPLSDDEKAAREKAAAKAAKAAPAPKAKAAKAAPAKAKAKPAVKNAPAKKATSKAEAKPAKPAKKTAKVVSIADIATKTKPVPKAKPTPKNAPAKAVGF